MLFWIFVFLLIMGIAGLIAYYNTRFGEWLWTTGMTVTVIAAIALAISFIFIGNAYIGVDGYIAENQARYDSLVYQYENDIYDNDNDLGKKELMDEIREWNEDLARYREIQDDFWIGIYIPDVYDQFDFIEYK